MMHDSLTQEEVGEALRVVGVTDSPQLLLTGGVTVLVTRAVNIEHQDNMSVDAVGPRGQGWRHRLPQKLS